MKIFLVTSFLLVCINKTEGVVGSGAIVVASAIRGQESRRPTSARYSPPLLPYRPTSAPYSSTSAPYRLTSAPYNPTSGPYSPTSATNRTYSSQLPSEFTYSQPIQNQNSQSFVQNLNTTTAKPVIISSNVYTTAAKSVFISSKEKKFYKFNNLNGNVKEISDDQFKNRDGVMTVVTPNWSTIGHFKDGEPNGFIVMINMKTKEVRAGSSTFLMKGIQLFPKEMRIRYYDTWKKHIEGDARYRVIEGSSWQFNDVLRNFDDINIEADLTAESTSMHCQKSASVDHSCKQKGNGDMGTEFDFGASGFYTGQLSLLPGNVGPSRHGFGHLNNLDKQSKYTGFWNDNKMNIFGVNRTKNVEFYAGQYYNGFQHGVGADLPMSKEHGTILVSKRVFGQANGPGVFIYPESEGLIFLGIFQNGKKRGKGIYIDEHMNVLISKTLKTTF